ncbi:phospholipase D [Butyriboletus roseoflavus]|nr:phospholipase D [Butyriboletus roseoflavus]
MATNQASSQSTPKTHQPVTFCDVVTATLAAGHSGLHANGTPWPPSEGAARTPVHDQRPVLHITTPSSSTAARVARPTSSVPNTPSARTGPPRSLSYHFVHSSSPIGLAFTSLDSRHGNEEFFENDLAEHPQPASQPRSQRRQSTFRGAMELLSSNIDKDFILIDRKGKARDTRGQDESRTSTRWFESPMDGKSAIIFEERQGSEQPIEHDRHPSRHHTTGFVNQDDSQLKDAAQTDIQRSQSHPPSRSIKRSGGSDRWGKLRALIPSVIRQSPSTATAHAVTPPEVNIIDELITGGLSNLMLGLWFERDDEDHRRVPVLLHRLRIRISDSLHPLHAHKAVFRIECEYANGAARWVIYRQLRDFISLHTHYTISNAFSSHKDKLPEFPRTTLPYFNFLKMGSGGTQIRQADFALSQREALENYLIKLIRAVMFYPSSNRLSGFLEISALFISLAQAGGLQYKAGFLRLEPSGNNPGLGRKATSRRARKQSRWCAVRESCLVVLEEPGELIVLDVFLLDADFKIVRPIRYYRKGLHLLRPEPADREFYTADRMHEVALPQETEIDCASAMDSITSRITRAFNVRQRSTPNVGNVENQENQSPPRPRNARHDSASSGSSVASNLSPPPMLDPSTHVQPLQISEPRKSGQEQNQQQDQTLSETEQRKRKKRSQDVSKHTFYVENSQMRLKLFARNERQMLQWITALEKAADICQFTTKNRFGSFAPIRMDVAAQWLVDGRDYMWNLSRALMMAKESIYIHDWWLSPELQLRRPNKDKYRLDRILERKASEGVKIYVILYQEVSSRTTPTDSNYAKQKLSSLHENIMIQRSPSHFQTGTFYWAHHEKLCVIDQTIAFMGGIDLCFGRWDTPQHVLVDDPELSPDKTELWPGKDYSNPRVLDFHTLHKPEEDMYDRCKVPRMPWHDVGVQVVGQPARDLAWHFIERWNWLLRIKNHTRFMPFLLPPPDFRPGELEAMGLTGTCEMQICRSAGPWSLGTPNRIEHSIQDAYIAAIGDSEYFVYIENQFFISSTVIDDVEIENAIGNALVRRIIRAKREHTPWKCCIIIPLFPGFPFALDHGDASAIRIIIDCQNRTLFRGENSIYERLRAEGIEPEDYIRVFSLRNWGKMRDGILTTEIVYIHDKICIVDDRLAIIGSANINERSQRGDRDSELAAVIRDTDMIEGTMAGSPFKVGRFAHTLRVRLMREHVGVDVDALTDEDYVSCEEVSYREQAQEQWDPNAEQESPGRQVTELAYVHERPLHDALHTAAHGIREGAQEVFHPSVTDGEMRDPGPKRDESSAQEGHVLSPLDEKEVVGFTSMAVPAVEARTLDCRPPALEIGEVSCPDQPTSCEDQKSDSNTDTPFDAHTAGWEVVDGGTQTAYEPSYFTSDHSDLTEDKSTTNKRSSRRKQKRLYEVKAKQSVPISVPHVQPDDFEDPISDEFWDRVWVACAKHNTEIYRKAFHAIPDDTVNTWKQYKQFVAYHERFTKTTKTSFSATPPPSSSYSEENGTNIQGVQGESVEELHDRDGKDSEWSFPASMPKSQHTQEKGLERGKSIRGSQPFDNGEWGETENLLKHIRGHLVLHPTHFLESEDDSENFLFNTDRLMPLPIYN